MLDYITNYIFGEESNASASAPGVVPHCKQVEEDWCYVDDNGRFSPVVIDSPEIRDIDELSLCSSKTATTANALPSAEQLKRAEDLRQAKEKTAQRIELERALFEEDMTASMMVEPANSRASPETWQRLKAKMAHEKSKTKRSKKASGKSSSGRSNDRKCNNIE